ncbi:cation diffusion facilitator family transporter [Tenacibaculum sp. SG-28]|uniref:cation diffusion facilitator family transporter n=1 Tax=Tenacibaculum sp. SG-28 TaxID=754426 RepID=UPI000D449DF1|nr:cation diffusion facilitator family transporter [Tenacibaculum sp. SG-28]PQJ23476.1 hypothetical protein BSU00_04675 [Tenacibaculum sp. SG-28]
MNHPRKKEKQAVLISIVMNFILAILALYYGFLTNAEAIMLDGYYSIAGGILAVISIYVIKLVYRPENKEFNFGYSSIEPLFNMVKGLLIFIVILTSTYNAVIDVINGGSIPDFSGAITYFILSTVACFLMSIYFYNLHKVVHTSLLDLEYKNWFIDTLISASVGATFFISKSLANTTLAFVIPYTDAIATLIIVAIVIKFPIQAILSGFKEILLSVPPKNIIVKIKTIKNEILSNNNIKNIHFKATKTGRETYVLFHLQTKHEIDMAVGFQDQIKKEILQKLRDSIGGIVKIDVCLTLEDLEQYQKL